MFYLFFFFNDTATTEIYTLSLHDALPISPEVSQGAIFDQEQIARAVQLKIGVSSPKQIERSEEHTSELQSQFHLVCRLLLEKKKNTDDESVNRQTSCNRDLRPRLDHGPRR